MTYDIGLHYGLTFSEYAAIPAINSGAINKGFTKKGYINLKRFHAAVQGRIDSDDTADRKLGRAIHCRLLEPERYAKEFLVASTCKAVKQDGVECGNPGKKLWDGEWYCGVRGHAPKEAYEPADYINDDQQRRIEALVVAVHEHDVFKAGMFKRPAWHEISIVEQERGMLCKCRLDRLDESGETIIDLKKMQPGTGDKETCEAKILEYGYHRQAAFYVKLTQKLTGKTPQFVWVFVEDDEPYDLQVIPANRETIQIGMHEVDQLLGQYAVAIQANKFPGYIHDARFIRYGGLPTWYIDQCLRAGILGDNDAGSAGAAQPEYAEF